MSKIVLIETSTNTCSVAVAVNGKIVSNKVIAEQKAHAKMLVPFIKEALAEAEVSLNDCSAIAVSEGPGSYTGLRVGVSTAKGLCYGADKPLIAVDTLEILAQRAVCEEEDAIIIPMLDARRMEVYSAFFSNKAVKLSETKAVVLDENSFSEEFQKYSKLIFVGDGAMKFKTVLDQESLDKSEFIECDPTAEYMLSPAVNSFNSEDFQDVAYFEPFYLKEFQAGVKKS